MKLGLEIHLKNPTPINARSELVLQGSRTGWIPVSSQNLLAGAGL